MPHRGEPQRQITLVAAAEMNLDGHPVRFDVEAVPAFAAVDGFEGAGWMSGRCAAADRLTDMTIAEAEIGQPVVDDRPDLGDDPGAAACESNRQ